MGQLILGRQRKQSQSQVLQVDGKRPETIAGRDQPLATTGAGHWRRPDPRRRIDGKGPVWDFADSFFAAGKTLIWRARLTLTSSIRWTKTSCTECRKMRRAGRPILNWVVRGACAKSCGTGT